jgi:uncharacterized membrane protein
MDLCQYANILGEPGKGIHKARIAGFALWDIVATLFVAAVIAMMSENPAKKFVQTSVVLLILAIFLHWLFCVPTALNKLLFEPST